MTQYTQKAFKLDKEYPMTCALFGSYFLLRKSYSTVDTLARKAIEHTDVMSIASDGWYLLGRKAHYESDLARAAEYYNRSDQARGGGDKGYLPAKFGTVQMQVSNKDYDGAKFRLEKIIQQTKNPECMILLGALHAEEVFAAQRSGSKEDKSADAKKAISLLESVRALWKENGGKKISPDESVLVYLARLYEQTAPEKSMQCLTQLEQLQLAEVSIEVDEEDEDKRNEFLRENLPPPLLNNMGCFLYQNEKIDQARAMFQTALNACVKSQEKKESDADTDALVTTVSYNLGRTYEASDMPDEAKKVYEGLLERHADYTEANARLTYIALRQSPTDEGPKRMAKLYEIDSTNLEVRALFGWYLSKSKKRATNLAEDHEQRHYKHTLQYYDKHDRYSLTGMGNVHLVTARDMRRDTDQEKEKRRKMYERAVEFFDKALQLDPRNAYAAQGIAIALVDDRKDHATAVHIFSRIRDTLKDASVYLNLGHVYAELRQYSRSIEHYEAALSKDRARDAQILACLGRVWLLRGKQETNLSAMKTALDYAQRALSVTQGQVHLEFNVAFVQNQIAQLAYGLPETQKTVKEVEEAAAGLNEAVETFGRLAKAKNPPYPADSLEQRANMGKTIMKQLDRALQKQKEYEEKNASKLQQAREAREAAIKQREEEVRKAREAEQERKKKVAEERQAMVEEAQRLAEERIAREREKEEAVMTTDSDTGDKVKRKKKSSKRKKKDDDFISEGEGEGGSGGEEEDGGASRKKQRKTKKKKKSEEAESGDEDEGAAPKKRRRLERRSGGKVQQGKFKSSEVVESSDEDDDAGEKPTRDQDEEMRDSAPAEGKEDDDEVVQRRRGKPNRRVADDDEDEEEAGETGIGGGGGVGSDDADEDDLFNDKGVEDAEMKEEE